MIIFNYSVKRVLLYSSETWRITTHTVNKIHTFVNRCLRRIMNVKWSEKISNTIIILRTKTNQLPVEIAIKRRKWRWIGHTLRKPPSSITRQALTSNPQGKRKRRRQGNTWRRDMESPREEEKTTARKHLAARHGIPKGRGKDDGKETPGGETWNPQGKGKRRRQGNTWRRHMESEMKKMGYTWQDIVTMAQRRIQWRALIDGPCSQRVDVHVHVQPEPTLSELLLAFLTLWADAWPPLIAI